MIKTLSDSKKFEVNTEDKTITIFSVIGTVDFYKECMHIFARAEFMDSDMPIIEEGWGISIINDWKIINKERIFDDVIKVRMV